VSVTAQQTDIATSADLTELEVAVGKFSPGTERFIVESDDRKSGSFEYDAETKVYSGDVEIEIQGIKDGTYVRVYYRKGSEKAERVRIIKAYDAYGGFWRKKIAFGIEFAQEREDFSEQDLMVQVSTDAMLSSEKGGGRWHSYVDVGLRSIPNAEGDTKAKEDPGDTVSEKLETFLASRKALRVETGTYWVKEIPKGNDVLNWGFGTAHGFNTITDFDEDEERAPGTEDTVNRFHTVFFRLAMHELVPQGVNPLQTWNLDLGGGYFENFFKKDELRALQEEGFTVGKIENRRWRFVADAQMRIPGTRDLFLGINVNVGKGSDDVRLFGTAELDLDALRSAF
jgi:hypothetical protein